MPVTLTSTTDLLTLATITTSQCTWTAPTAVINSSVASGSWLVRAAIPVGPSLAATVTITITNTGVASISLQARVWMLNSAVSSVGSAGGDTKTIAAGASATWTIVTVTSAAAVTMRADINLGSASGSGWTFRIDALRAVVTASPDEIVSAALDRPLNAAAFDSGVSRAAIITRAPAGALVFRGVYLCPSFAAALIVDSLHQYPGTVTASGATAGELAGVAYTGTGKLTMAAEKAVPGKPSRWLVTVEGSVA